MANLTSGREYFKNIIKETYQQTGAIGALETISERNSFVSSVKQFEAGYVVNWQTILYPLLNGVTGSEYKKFSGVRSGPWAEYDGLDPQYGGLSGWTLTAEPWATAEGLECLWDKGKAQPNSITAALYCLSSKIDAIEILSNREVDPYDDSELRSQIVCLNNDFLRIYKDAIGCGASLKCSSEKTLEFSLLRHIYEIFDQVIDGGPNIPFTFDCEKSYPELSIKLLVSNLIYDVLIDQKYIRGLSVDLECIREWIGMMADSACLPEYGDARILNYISNGDNLVEAIFKLDQAIQSSSVNLQEAYDAGDTRLHLPGYIELSTPTGLGSSSIYDKYYGGSFTLANHSDIIEHSAAKADYAQAIVDLFVTVLTESGLMTQAQIDQFISLGGIEDSLAQAYLVSIVGSTAFLSLISDYQQQASEIATVAPLSDLLGDAPHFMILDGYRKENNDSADMLRRSNELIKVEEHPVGRKGFINSKTGLAQYPEGTFDYGTVNIRRSVLITQPRSDVPYTMDSGHTYGSGTNAVTGEDETAIWVASGFSSDGVDYFDCNGEPVGDNNLYFRKPGNGTIYKLNTCGTSGSSSLSGLNDTTIEIPQMGDILMYNSTGDVWQNTTLSIKKNADVDSSMMPTDGQVLIWNATTDQWTAADYSGSDNLGNHIASQDLNMSSFKIDNVYKINMIPVDGQSPAINSPSALNFNSQLTNNTNICDYNFSGRPAGNGLQTAAASINLGSGGGGFVNIQPANGTATQQVWHLPQTVAAVGQILKVSSINAGGQTYLEWSNECCDAIAPAIETINTNTGDPIGNGSLSWNGDSSTLTYNPPDLSGTAKLSDFSVTTGDATPGSAGSLSYFEGVFTFTPPDITSFSGNYADLTGTPTIPTNTSQLTNDSGFVTTDTNTWRTITVAGNTLSTTESLNVTAGSGILLTESGGNVTITNTNPDQVVSLTGSGATTVTGTYPNFTISSTDTNTNTQLTTEQVQDIVGGMVSGNVETGMSVTYDDASGKLNFNVTASGSGVTRLSKHVDYARGDNHIIDPHNIISIYAYFSGTTPPGSVSFDRTSTVNGGWQNGDTFKIVNLSNEQTLTFIANPMVIVGSAGLGAEITQTTLSPGKSVEGYWENNIFYVFEL